MSLDHLLMVCKCTACTVYFKNVSYDMCVFMHVRIFAIMCVSSIYVCVCVCALMYSHVLDCTRDWVSVIVCMCILAALRCQ